MMADMIGLRGKDPEVRRIVVRRSAVDVMDNLAGLQRTPQHVCRYESMFVLQLAVHPKLNVACSIQRSSPPQWRIGAATAHVVLGQKPARLPAHLPIAAVGLVVDSGVFAAAALTASH